MLFLLRLLSLSVLVYLGSVLPAWAQVELKSLSLKVPTRYDTRIDQETGELSKDRFQYQLSLRSEIGLLNPVSYTHLTLPTICSV